MKNTARQWQYVSATGRVRRLGLRRLSFSAGWADMTVALGNASRQHSCRCLHLTTFPAQHYSKRRARQEKRSLGRPGAGSALPHARAPCHACCAGNLNLYRRQHLAPGSNAAQPRHSSIAEAAADGRRGGTRHMASTNTGRRNQTISATNRRAPAAHTDASDISNVAWATRWACRTLLCARPHPAPYTHTVACSKALALGSCARARACCQRQHSPLCRHCHAPAPTLPATRGRVHLVEEEAWA